MRKSVWLFQIAKEVRTKGADQSSWYVGWYDLAGIRQSESCGPGSRGHDAALKRQRRLLAELDLGVHQSRPRESWQAFREHFEAEVLSGMEPATRSAYEGSLDVFAKHTRVRRMAEIDTLLVDRFTRKRLEDPGRKPNSTLSRATVAKDLRMLKAALTRAVDWGFLPALPKIRPPKQAEKLVRYVTDEHFAILYEKACQAAKLPAEPDQGFTSEEWWRALIVTATMTGFRIKEILAIRREDLDFEKGTIVTRKADNKGKRDERLPLHPIVIEHLKPLGDAEFPLRWPLTKRRLWTEWQRIQKKAGIHLQCIGDHEHTDSCHVYGFHDFRRAFATNNAAHLKPETLQKLMRHRSYTTTLRYINMARQVDHAIDAIVVPEVLRPKQAEPTDTTAEKPGKQDCR